MAKRKKKSYDMTRVESDVDTLDDDDVYKWLKQAASTY